MTKILETLKGNLAWRPRNRPIKKITRKESGRQGKVNLVSRITSMLSLSLLVSKVRILLKDTFLGFQNLDDEHLPYLHFLERIAKTRGELDAISLHKKVRLYVTRYIAGEPCSEVTQGVSLTKDCLPKCLGSKLIKIIRIKDPLQLKWALTILYSTRALSLGKDPEVESILTPPKIVDFQFLLPFMHSFWKELGFPRKIDPKKINFKSFHQTSNSGPNGHALWMWWKDLTSLPESLVKSIGILGGELLQKRILLLSKYSSIWDKFFPVKLGRKQVSNPKFRKLVSFPDSENKVRVVAIGDYFSQSSLLPLHNLLYKILRKIPQDCTFDQTSFSRKLTTPKGHYHSIDLTAFTDRFPIKLISMLLQQVLPPERIIAWEDIMIGYPFPFKGKDLPYQAGTPMGFYSSWGASTLAHHFIVYVACKKANIKWKTANYVLLGDDIVIGDDLIAEQYKLLIKGIGVEFSDMKTHTSVDTYEFAKRWWFRGVDISPFPCKGWVSSVSVLPLITNFLIDITERGFIPLKDLATSYCKSLELLGLPSRLRAKSLVKFRFLEIIMKMIMLKIESIKGVEILWQLHLKTELHEAFRNEEAAGFLIQNACMDAYSAAIESESSKKGQPLGKIAEDLLLSLTRPGEIYSEDSFALIDSLPILNVYGQIENKYLTMKRTVWKLSTSPEPDFNWPTAIRGLTIPSSDRILHERNHEILPRACATIIPKVLAVIDEQYLMVKNGWV